MLTALKKLNLDQAIPEGLKMLAEVGPLNVARIARARFGDMVFDRRYGVDTLEQVKLESLAVDRDAAARGQRYQASSVRGFTEILRRVQPEASDVFVDFGCGKGRTLLLAARHGVARAIGVEFSAELCAIARTNIERFRVQGPLRSEFVVHNLDAREFTFDGTETLVYFFNPFDASILRPVVDNLKRSLATHPRRVRVIYYYPAHREVFADDPAFRPLVRFFAGGHDCEVYESA
jgi:SAM-dependent methyltransferase